MEKTSTIDQINLIEKIKSYKIFEDDTKTLEAIANNLLFVKAAEEVFIRQVAMNFKDPIGKFSKR